MDICRWSVFSSVESISFRWIIIVMIYLATIILSLAAETMDKHLFLPNVNSTVIEREMVNHFISLDRYPECMSIVR